MLANGLSNLAGLGDAPKLAETLLSLMPEASVLIIDTELRVVAMRGPIFVRHGFDGSAAVGRDLHDIIPATAWERAGAHWRAALAGESRTIDMESADGQNEYWLHFAPLTTNAAPVGAIVIAQDITDRVLGRDELRRRLAQQAAVSALGSLTLRDMPVDALLGEAARVLHETLASDLIMVLETTADGDISVRASTGEKSPAPPPVPSADVRRTVGHMRAAGETLFSTDLSTETTFDAPGLEAEGMLSLVAAPIGSGATAFGELVACSRRRDAFSENDLAFVESVANLLMAAVERDRTVVESHREQALATGREEQLNDAQRLAQMGSWDVDFATGTHTLSENMRVMLALDSCISTDDVFLALVHPADRRRMQAAMAAPEDHATADFRVQLPSGRVRALSSLVRLKFDTAGTAVGLRGTLKDVTEARRAEEALRRSEERFRQGFDNAPIGMVLVDPDGLRYLRVNDAFCGMVGQTRAALLELTFAEVGGPEDRPAIGQDLPLLRSGELPELVTEKRYPRPDGTEVWASVSITPVLEPDGSVDVLFGQMVDITERKAREASLKAQLDEIAGLGEIRRAFEEDRFEMHAQPIIDLATNEIVQRELLIRMRGRDGELIPPGSFLPAAEKHGAIRDIDRWVLAQGAALAARGIDVEINISAASIGDPGLIADIERELKRTGADPSRLVFEITETALIEETGLAVALAERLRKLGCRFALDDFGSGYGGFHYLKHLPMDFLKIDREFVRDMRTSVADQHVIRAIVGLAHGFGLKTIAEGVEDQETLDLLREFGVDHAQGFLIGRPAPLPPSPAA